MCYYCGECTATCPRQADPGEFMAAARRYAIARYDRLGLARLLYTSAAFNVLFLALLAAVLGVFLYSFHGPMPGDTLRLFEFIPARRGPQSGRDGGDDRHRSWRSRAWSAWRPGWQRDRHASRARVSTGWPHCGRPSEKCWGSGAIAGLRSIRAERNPGTSKNGSSMPRCCGASWGCSWRPLWITCWSCWESSRPERGCRSGTRSVCWARWPESMLIYGVTVAIVKRLRKTDEAAAYSTPSDWAFLILLWLGGMTGFALEVAIYLPQPHAWGYWMLLAHLVVVGELLLLLPFTKFAHAIYRTVALYVHALKPVPGDGTRPARRAVGLANNCR